MDEDRNHKEVLEMIVATESGAVNVGANKDIM